MNNHFNTRKIPKADGGKRTIYIYKDVELKRRHSDIKNYLTPLWEQSSTSYAYLGKQVYEAITPHLGNKYFIKTDISGFFDNINMNKVKDEINKIIPSNIIDYETIVMENKNGEMKGTPMGSVLAPLMSDIALKAIDEWSIEENLTYSRYSDDILISGNDEEVLLEQFEELSKKLMVEGFTINNNKTKKYNSENGGSFRYLGLNVVFGKDSNYITCGRRRKKTSWHKYQLANI